MDSDTFWKLLRPIHPAAVRFCRKLAEGVDEGDDLYQDALLLAWRRVGTLRQTDAFRPWLYRIIVNLHISRSRRPWRKLRVSLTDWMAATLPGPDNGNSVDSARLLNRLLGLLRAEDRSLFILYELDGWSISELSEMTGRPEGTIKTRLRRARRKMRKAVERQSASTEQVRLSSEVAYALQRCKTPD